MVGKGRLSELFASCVPKRLLIFLSFHITLGYMAGCSGRKPRVKLCLGARQHGRVAPQNLPMVCYYWQRFADCLRPFCAATQIRLRSPHVPRVVDIDCFHVFSLPKRRFCKAKRHLLHSKCSQGAQPCRVSCLESAIAETKVRLKITW